MLSDCGEYEPTDVVAQLVVQAGQETNFRTDPSLFTPLTIQVEPILLMYRNFRIRAFQNNFEANTSFNIHSKV